MYCLAEHRGGIREGRPLHGQRLGSARQVKTYELDEICGGAMKSGGGATMRDPVFTQTVQIGIVVRDLDAAMRKYVDDYGIGPWKIYEFNPGNAKDLREYGQPVKRSWRLAIAMVGQLQWELIEPLDNEGIYARFLAEKGGGVHHIAVAAQSFDEMLAMEAERGIDVVLSGEFEGVRVAYLGTDRDLGVLLEIFSGMPNLEQKR
jgi:methylmalonyl-CoA/ethylmalonyl-CoA epimerase